MTYDALNRLTTMIDGVGTTHYTYTPAGLPQSEDGPWNDDTVTYVYNSAQLRTSLSLQAPSASPWSESYGYDSSERLTNLTSPAGVFGYAYDPTRHLQVNVLSLPNSGYITNTFDPLARLLTTVLRNSTNGALNSHSYVYNTAGQRLSVTNTFGDYRQYGYDSAGQLTSELSNDPGGTNRFNERFNYRYDAAGNLSLRTYPSGNSDPLTETFSENTLNEMTNMSRSGTFTVAGTTTSPATNVTVNITNTALLYVDYTFACTNAGVANGTNTYSAIAKDNLGRSDTNTVSVYLPTNAVFTYDANGNLLGDGSRNFTYDDDNQLISVVVTNTPGISTRSDFVYDGRMRRRMRFESAWSGAAWITNTIVRYIYDGNQVIQERDANNLPTISYTRSGGTLFARTDHSLLAIQAPSAHVYYHTEANANVTALVNASQAIVARYLYDPFGNTLALSGPMAASNLYRSASKETHQNSDLTYFGLRFYDPKLQRWLNRDPISEFGGKNLYAFTGNDPVNLYDEMGLAAGFGQSLLQSVYNNGLSDALQYATKLAANAANAALNSAVSELQSVYQYETDPLGFAYDQYQKLVNALDSVAYAGAYWGKFSADPCERQRALAMLNEALANPDTYADVAFGIDMGLLGTAGPELLEGLADALFADGLGGLASSEAKWYGFSTSADMSAVLDRIAGIQAKYNPEIEFRLNIQPGKTGWTTAAGNIELYNGYNLGTVMEEMLHVEYLHESGLINGLLRESDVVNMERAATTEMRQMGFELNDVVREYHLQYGIPHGFSPF